jgi:hypothetical protein
VFLSASRHPVITNHSNMPHCHIFGPDMALVQKLTFKRKNKKKITNKIIGGPNNDFNEMDEQPGIE